MMQTASIADNISEVLVKIINFTQLRRRVLQENLHKAGHAGFTPQDMPVREFAEAINMAVAEHLQNHRLLFHDTPSIRFGPYNTMEVQPVADPYACALLQTNPDQYTEVQIRKLLENCLNRKVAEELLRQKCGTGTIAANWDLGKSLVDDSSLGNSTADRDRAD
jgi:hypothetical protein